MMIFECHSHHMNIEMTEEIRTKLAELSSSAVQALRRKVHKIYYPDGRHTFVSDAKIDTAVQELEREVSPFVDILISQTLRISVAPHAYLLLHEAFSSYLLDFEAVILAEGHLALGPDARRFAHSKLEPVRLRLTELLESHRPKFGNRDDLGGRPRVHDWDRMMAYIVAVANTPDGLPDGETAEKDLKNLMYNWFMSDNGKIPDSKDVNARFEMVVAAIDKLKTPEN